MFVACLVLPFMAWFIAKDYFDLSQDHRWWATFGAVCVSVLVLRLTANYLTDEFAKSYTDGGNWDYLSSRFGVERKPSGADIRSSLIGYGRLDRDDVLFDSEVAVTDIGVYVNFAALGRILVPWQSIGVLRGGRLATDDGWQPSVEVLLEGPDAKLEIPWDESLAEAVPESVGLS